MPGRIDISRVNIAENKNKNKGRGINRNIPTKTGLNE